MKNSNKATLGGGEKKMATPKTGVKPTTTEPTGEVKEELLEHPIVLGRGSDGKMVEATLGELKSTLIGGLSGSGKSSLLQHIVDQSKDQAQVIVIDLKRIGFLRFKGEKNVKIVTDINKTPKLFQILTQELENRYREMEAKNIDKCSRGRILIVVDEAAELTPFVDKNVMEQIRRILSLGRACNMTLIMATQSPSRRLLSGALVDLFPSRIALRCNSVYASKVVIDRGGAEKLPNYSALYVNPFGFQEQVSLMPPLDESDNVDNLVAHDQIEWDED